MSEPKTILQIAKEIGATKQQVYRYIKKNHLKEVDIIDTAKRYDAQTVERIKKGVKDSLTIRAVNTSTQLNEMVLSTIKEQQETIKQLTKLLDQEQQLRMVAENKLKAIEEKQESEQTTKKKWWKFGAE